MAEVMHGGARSPVSGDWQWQLTLYDPIWQASLLSSVMGFYARKQLPLPARLSHRNSVRPFVCPSVTRVDQSKTVQAKITNSSPSTAWKTLVSGTVNLFHKFEKGHPEPGR